MKRRNSFFCSVLMSLGLISVQANPSVVRDVVVQPADNGGGSVSKSNAPPNISAPLPPAPSRLVADKILSQAYYDTLSILAGNNSCSDFFGGSTKALVVFNTLMTQVRKDYLATSIGMRMTGSVTTVTNAPTQAQFRLFDKMSINANGPFYRRRLSPTQTDLPRLGGYEPNTREVRAHILLHELGHLMKGDDGNWLLPDDGKATAKSHDNSEKIEDVCGEQIKHLVRNGSK